MHGYRTYHNYYTNTFQFADEQVTLANEKDVLWKERLFP